MKHFLILVAVGLAALGFDAASPQYGLITRGDSLTILRPEPQHPRQATVIVQLLNSFHYRKMEVDDSVSYQVFGNLFEMLDPNHAFFLQEDIARYEDYRYLIDDQLPEGDLSLAFEVFNDYRELAVERYEKINELLNTPFDFNTKEYFDVDRDMGDYPETPEQRDELWRKIIKNQALSYKMAGKEWEEIASSLRKRYDRIKKSLYQYNSEDVFELYMNALTQVYDPHTAYLSPIASDNLEISMNLSLEGIGARLTQQLDYTVVSDVVPGGPAFKSKQLNAEDRIIGVAQGEEGEFIDVIGWRLDDVVQKIRGPKGTVVRLQILKKAEGINALPDTVRIVRDKIKLEEQEAQSEIITINEEGKDYKLGVIKLPSFYINFEERARGVQDYKSTTRDVKKLIENLKKANIDGLLLDLRDNGGGSLDEAVDLSGLFIPSGVMVQTKDMLNKIERMSDQDGGTVVWDGPLTVLINRYSASASEIFSGAIQDYQRGLILGENTYGKGTVQSLLDIEPYLNQRLSDLINIYRNGGDEEEVANLLKLREYLGSRESDLGKMKMTIAKFYRVSGSSTQRVGVSPDIYFPSPYDPKDFGESEKETALPWDEILGAGYQPTGHVKSATIDELNQLYAKHLYNEDYLLALVKEIEERKKLLDQKTISLNLEERKQEQQDMEDLNTEIEGEVAVEGVAEDPLEKDPYLKEGVRLLIALTQKSLG